MRDKGQGQGRQNQVRAGPDRPVDSLLTQLVQYLVVCHIANLTPGEFHSRLSGATGHSQGIVSAVVIAASGTFEEHQ